MLTLIIGIGPSLYSLNYPDPELESLLYCKIFNYLFQICLMLSRWYVTFAGIDRYALTSQTVQLRNLARPKVAYCVILVINIIWIIISSHRLVFYEIKDNICGIVSNLGAALYQSIYVILGGGIVPVTIMILSAYLIHRNLAHRHQRRMHLISIQRRVNPLDRQLLKILFVQIISYIIIIIPQISNLMFNTVLLTIPNRSEEHVAIGQFVAFLAELTLYLFPVLSFYLYTLTSRTFRNELMKFFCSIHVRCCGHRIAPAVNNTDVHQSLANRQPTGTMMAMQHIN